MELVKEHGEIIVSEDVTNMKVSKIEDAESFSSLVIRGYAADLTTGKQRLEDLRIYHAPVT